MRMQNEETDMETQLRYEIVIYWNSDDGVFIAEAPELGCIAEGWCYEAALLNGKIEIEDLRYLARKAGQSLPEPQGRRRSA